ncbi:nuclear transport factor 2 family protein [Pseudalkalibacillus caeni]|uniref:Steroid delta-isomerase n=1 Tax=Exobacillus caeni TaxID=2574798 RepID=A0A5R9FB77_9BACL|nr:nuclear transport factor 2 family protein [Pseudalkalibacillus caeni]TLS36875.1 steroid delta-isomerase [Pseudalkalibacillus caeni]
MSKLAKKLAQAQLDAYNSQDIEAFLAQYSEDVTVLNFPTNSVVYTGKEAMRERYTKLFKENPNNHAELLSRIVKENIIIDQEFVTGRANGIEVDAIAIYGVKNEKISKVWFVK